ncbi:MAG: hypothetical protein P8P12_04830 [Porticoccaceae bacterium]|nr:hypothetical protein [Porticoccaceae bacterium]
MKTRSSSITVLVNILVILFMMNTTLAHSTCTMSSSSENPDLVQQAEHSPQTHMPCHTLDSGDKLLSLSAESSPDTTPADQCCADCSVFSLPISTVKTPAAVAPNIASTALTSTPSRTIELPFRPPIADLS